VAYFSYFRVGPCFKVIQEDVQEKEFEPKNALFSREKNRKNRLRSQTPLAFVSCVFCPQATNYWR